tara:strand:+ start:455 stop:634 length:180 start_codon:yes stop_codon:yes gene_type:complete
MYIRHGAAWPAGDAMMAAAPLRQRRQAGAVAAGLRKKFCPLAGWVHGATWPQATSGRGK